MTTRSVTLCPTFGVGYQAFDANGLPLNAGKIYTYAAGTSTPQATYTTSDGSTANANPIVFGADGRPPYEIWLLLGYGYKFEVQDSLGNVIADYDNILAASDIAFATVASAATTADIWSPLGPINFTGVATVTAFPAAPVAGAKRTLICAGACLFTAGANMLIIGIASGKTITMKANARVTVTALTTTQFQLEYSLDGSFTASLTGLTAPYTATWTYTVINGLVSVSALTMFGTSNTANATITGLPAEITPQTTRGFGPWVGFDGASTIYTVMASVANTSIMTLSVNATLGSWANSGTKGIFIAPGYEFEYRL